MPKPRPKQPPRNRAAAKIAATVTLVTITGAEAPTEKAPARFSMIANTGEPMRICGFDVPVVVDIETVDLTDQRIPALYDHWADIGSVVGQVESLTVENKKLVANGRFTIPPPDPNYGQSCAERVLALARSGYQWQASVGGDPRKVEEIQAGAVGIANWGREYPGPCVIGRGLKLRELSFVVLGGDRKTSVVTAGSGVEAMDFTTFVQSMGFDPEKLDETQSANLKVVHAEKYPEGDTDTEAEGDADPAEEKDPPVNAEGDTEEEKDVAPANAAAKKPTIRGKRKSNTEIKDEFKAEMRAAAAEERKRTGEINALATEYGNPDMEITENGQKSKVSFAARAIEAGWSIDRAKAEMLDVVRNRRSEGPAVLVRSHDRDCSVQALQAAMILRAGGRLDHRAYQSSRAVDSLPSWLRMDINAEGRQRIMEAAHRYAEFSAIDLCKECIRLDGHELPRGKRSIITAAVSGLALTNVFTTNINAILLATYLEAPDTTVGWVREQDVNDYRLNERPRLLKGAGLAKRPRGGEADHMTRSDSGESYKIAHYAGQIEVDEQDFIDDNLSAFADLPIEMGNAASRLRPDLVYAIILANPTLTTTGRALFNSTDGNLLTTATFAAATLRAAVAAQNRFRENSVNLNLQTSHVIVPSSLRHLNYELVNSSEIFVKGNTDAERGVLNALKADGLTPVSDARLENGVVNPADGTSQSGSATTWYTACKDAQTIEVGYLAGTGRSPRTRSWKHAGEGKYGMGWDVDMSIGAKALDWKGFTKNTA